MGRRGKNRKMKPIQEPTEEQRAAQVKAAQKNKLLPTQANFDK